MHKNLTIYNELKELDSLLAAIPAINIYSVPDGYFDGLTPAILLHVHRQETQKMDVPGGYFEGLADNIMSRIKLESLATADETENSLLDTVKNINVYTVPPGYFDSLPESILSKVLITGVDNEEESALLAPAKNINVYTVPVGYFDVVAGNLMKQISTPAKVVQMGKRRALVRYAVAAVITGILGFSLFTVFNKSGDTKSNNELAAILKTGKEIADENSFDKKLDEISDDDIVNYLQASGQDVNAALVASATDEKTLPGEEEYLYDEKTLDNFLSDLNISENNSKSN